MRYDAYPSRKDIVVVYNYSERLIVQKASRIAQKLALHVREAHVDIWEQNQRSWSNWTVQVQQESPQDIQSGWETQKHSSAEESVPEFGLAFWNWCCALQGTLGSSYRTQH